ncbi:MAG: hypothetical protein ONB48_16685 [candidate division KSB1 bacterium]|nr:hypothetical protein [candidate division KSB1 bacterium]MDZ7274192.1 hypothetical protein [candidate division KSB1 bacterium]MDZ7287286.1 hypothetical protein [candidate division KSB1 bacterium]MDZ7296790.1 hypothetical protein [candidate division KSB1 bacterium]MDZ7347656.1 hypothetical protein [candidate division KSB1 bacterium]
MNPILRNVLAVIAGVVVGSIVNMSLVSISGKVIPPPAGVDVTKVESLKASMHLFEPKHFIFPFLAHALGTLVGAFVASIIAASHKIKFALGVGVFFLLGGIASIFMLPSPIWFTVLDLAGAYIPMGWLGHKLAQIRFGVRN